MKKISSKKLFFLGKSFNKFFKFPVDGFHKSFHNNVFQFLRKPSEAFPVPLVSKITEK